MKITSARPEDTEQIKQLWMYCFDDSEAFIDLFFKMRYRPETTLVAYEGDKVCSALQLLPYQIHIRGRMQSCAYVAGVSTWPEFRGKGYVRLLLKAAVTHMAEVGIFLSFLLPFQYDFYRKYGWEICYDRVLYHNVMKTPSRDTPKEATYSRITPKDIEILSSCYQSFMTPYNGYVLRTVQDWQMRLLDLALEKGAGYLLKGEAGASGYIFYTLSDKVLTIKELVYNHPHSRDALLTLAGSHLGGQVDQIRFFAPVDDLWLLKMQDPRGLIQREAYVMGRLNSVHDALSGMPTQVSPRLVLSVEDSSHLANEACYYLDNDSGKLRVTQALASPDAAISIATLSQLYWGYLSASQAYRQGLIRVESSSNVIETLDTLFPNSVPFVIEDY